MLSYSSYSNSQTVSANDIFTTDNLVNFSSSPTATTSAWQNVGQFGGNLTCWGPGGQGYCGPQPYVNSNGYGMINFSYGYTDLYQTVNIANALANSGTGLRVNGFNFSFTAKNGNGWDGGRQDYLAAYVKLYDAAGNITENFDYSQWTNKQYNWKNFNFSETFKTPYASADLSTAQYGFVGYDTNYWAGPYGPEIYNVKFNLKFSYDPCSADPMYSASCPGYLDAMKKLLPQTTTESVTITPTTTGVTVTAIELAPVTTTPSTTSLAAPTTSVATSPTTTVSNSQPKAGEVTVSGSKPTVSLSSIMNMISAEQSRIGAVEKSVVQMAVSDAAKAGEQSQQQAEAVAGTLTTQSMLMSNATTSTIVGSNRAGTTQSVVSISNTQSVANSMVGLKVPAFTTSTDVITASMLGSSGPAFTVTLPPTRGLVSPETELPQSEGIKFGTRSTLGDYLEAKTFMSMMGMEPTQDGMVKRNVQPNEVAGGVDIATMAVQPKGYDAYAQMTLSDAAFYKVEAIYKDQRTVDNQRNLRGLQGSSDRLHQEMVDQQYKIGN